MWWGGGGDEEEEEKEEEEEEEEKEEEACEARGRRGERVEKFVQEISSKTARETVAGQ